MRWLIATMLCLVVWTDTTHGQSSTLMGAYNRYSELFAQGRYQEALPIAQQALKLAEQEFGSNDPSTAAILNDLAGLYEAQGMYAEAEPLYQRSLAIVEKALGPEHPHVATSLNNLAELYRAMSRSIANSSRPV